ncbi:hypothetical protein HMPREF9442_01729 [Paraprevotella xylaniphila YIT 11841]|uniref:Uncharacterized protein n=1 Tax=Paraprevotella xylaniphila YIT 11841 TaxID=762982 RepID=F3QU58_9BACT|nr:hypothetical protein HMPREF9442_01729 [Paraprevotella xylaniphila YIT 11841]
MIIVQTLRGRYMVAMICIRLLNFITRIVKNVVRLRKVGRIWTLIEWDYEKRS